MLQTLSRRELGTAQNWFFLPACFISKEIYELEILATDCLFQHTNEDCTNIYDLQLQLLV
jgi:hypothetical protein